MAYGAWAGQRWRTVWNNGYYRVDVLWDYCQDIANNKTMVALCSQRCTSLNGYYSFVYTATEVGFGDFNGTKHGTTASVSVPGGGSHTVNLSHLHCEVSHNADGTWNNNLCGWWRYNVPLGGQNHSPNIGWTAFGGLGDTIPTIPRATTPTLSAGTVAMGSAVTINLPRASTVFTHVVTYRFGSASGTISSNATTSYSWTPPVTLAQQIKSSTSGVGTITVQTKNGSTVIGTKTINITLTVPASVVPTISAHTAVEATANLASKFGALVQSKSTLKVTTTAAGAQGSTITAYKTEVDGRSYTGSPCTTAALSRSGTVAVKTTVTDSRGRTASHTVNVTVVAYSPPQISVSNVARTSDEATTGTCTYNYSISSVGSKNDKAFYIQYLSGSTWTDIVRMSTDYSKSGSQTTGAIFGVDATTKVRFVAQDYFTTVSIEKEVGPTFTLMNVGAGGKSLAIGMLSSNNGTFETGLPFVSGGVRYTAKKFIATANAPQWLKVCTLKNTSDSDSAFVHVYTGAGWNARANQQTEVEIFVKDSWQSSHSTTDAFGGSYNVVGTYHPGIQVKIIALSASSCEIWLHLPWAYSSGFFTIESQCEVEVEGKCHTDAPTGANQTMGNLTPDNRGYPIGSVKITYNSVNPSANMGGTWVQFSQGRVLLGQGTGSDGSTSQTFGAGATGGRYTSDQINTTNSALSGFPSNGPNYADRCIVRKQAAGYNQERDAMISLVQPYQVIYAWRRTA
ncbi:DUF859 family phage minor structural protein [Faecalibaculum rodentium]|uniref:DUF859 family phage minor structural protein n=2 Tax=Faecalibaculum rodentium TaxID=1702221 RepID=UPI0025AF5A21|nr:DUF859 family phage minor structural protein [Faecalibaculum rodentium]